MLIHILRLVVITLLLAIVGGVSSLFPETVPVVLAQEDPAAAYLAAIQKTEAMVTDAQAQGLAAKYGLNIVNVTWEDTGRFYNSSVGPNISDVTIQVQHEDPATGDYNLTLMPVIRYPNFADLTADLSPDQFYLLVGNEAGEPLERVSLSEYLSHFRHYLSDPDSWTADEISLLAERDTHVLVSAQAAFLPVPQQGQAEFNPVLFNYQSYAGDPAVLTIVATREGTSATIIDNVRDAFPAGFSWGQRLFFNQNGQRASFTGERLSDFVSGAAQDQTPEVTASAGQESGLNMVLLIQVPLKQKQPFQLEEEGLFEAEAPAVSAGMAESDVEAAVIGHGPVEGPFTEIDYLPIERDERFPIRVTVQFYKATSNGVVSAADMEEIAAQLQRVYADGDYVGSLVVGGPSERATEYEGSKDQPAGWWHDFWQKFERNTGLNRQDVVKLWQSLGAYAGSFGEPRVTPPPQSKPVEIEAGEPFKLPFGREAHLQQKELAFRFESVLEESRCPSQVDCIVAGQARILLVVEQADQEVASLELSTSPVQQQDFAIYEPYEIRLVDLDPYPEDIDQPLEPESYNATLLVSELQ